MEFLPIIGLVLGVYAAFVILFFRFLHLMRQKEHAVLREAARRS